MLSAPPDQVYVALVNRDALLAWLPPTDMAGTFERFDPRPGGAFRLVLTYADASASRGKATAHTDVVESRFIELVPGQRVVQAVDFVSDDPGRSSRPDRARSDPIYHYTQRTPINARSTQRTEELSYVVDEQLRRFKRGEVASNRKIGPVHDVAALFAVMANGDVLGKDSYAYRGRRRRPAPVSGAVHVLVVQAGR